MEKDVVTREYYAKKLDAWFGKHQIIVLTGQRRVGKSFVLRDFINRYGADDNANIIYVNKEKKEFDGIRTYSDLNEYIGSRFSADRHNYILVDEIQEIDGWEKTVRSYRLEDNTDIIITGSNSTIGWEKTVRSYRLEDNTDIIITGSNSTMLSGELGTLIGGRYQEIFVQPLTYNEFLMFHKLEDTEESLRKYLYYGGLPGLRQTGLDDEDLVTEYLSGVFNTIMLKDIIERHSIRNITFLNNLIRFFADTTGKLNSVNNISNYLKSRGQDVSAKTVSAYINYFCEAYLLASVRRYDLHGKKLLESNDKLYFGDVGLRNIIAGGERESDMEKVIENVVYQHLIHLGYKVSVGQLRAGEVDFVCTRTRDRRYVQVAYIIADDSTRQRELGTLENINDNYPKYVISMTPLVRRSDSNGIIHLGLREFLRNGF